MNVVAYISGHGLGHLAQTAPALNALHERVPDLNLTVRTEIPSQLLDLRLKMPFSVRPGAVDVGFVMSNALDIDRHASQAAYARFHDEFVQRVSREARWLDDERTDLVVVNVSHVGAAAAHAVGIRGVGLCSLNWADLYLHYFGRDEIYARIRDAYATLDRFFCPAPSMPMPALRNRVDIGCIALTGNSQRQKLIEELGLTDDVLLGVVTSGGLDFEINAASWSVPDDCFWIMPDSIGSSERMRGIDQLDWYFLDILASVDLVIGKPGYGIVSESAVAGTSMLYVERNDWPEQDALIDWLRVHGYPRLITRTQLETGNFIDEARATRQTPRPAPVEPNGATQFATNVLDLV